MWVTVRADSAVSKKIEFDQHVSEGAYVFRRGDNIKARKVLYIGVGPLHEFRYAQIRKFARDSLEIAGRDGDQTRTICTPIHGPGYGLDEKESFLSLIGGFLDAIKEGIQPDELNKIEIVEINKARADQLRRILSETLYASQMLP